MEPHELRRGAGALHDAQGEPRALEPVDALAADGGESQPDRHGPGGSRDARRGRHDDRLAAAPEAPSGNGASDGDLAGAGDDGDDRSGNQAPRPAIGHLGADAAGCDVEAFGSAAALGGGGRPSRWGAAGRATAEVAHIA